MSDSSIWEAAKQGDINAISSLVSSAFKNKNITVEAEIQHDIILWLKIHSLATIEPKICTQIVIKTLNEIQINKILSVRISGLSSTNKNKQLWNKYLSINKEGQCVDFSKAANLFTYVALAILACGVILPLLTNKSSTSSTATSI